MAGWQDDPVVDAAQADFSADPEVEAQVPQMAAPRAALQGLSFGFGDEAVAALVASARQLGGDERSFMDIYEDVASNEREQIAQYRELAPVKAFLSEGAGALLTGGAAGARILGKQAAKKLPKWLSIAGVAGAEGLIYGAGSAEPGERIEGAAKTGLASAVLTPPLAAVGRVAVRLIGDAGKYVVKRLAETPAGEAVRLVREAAEQAGLKADEIVRKFQDLGPDGLLLDTDENFRALMRSMADRFGPAKRQARETLEERQLGQVGRLVREIEDASGTAADDYVDSMKGLAKQRAEKSAPFYEAAWGAEPSGTMLALAERPALKAALARATRLAANEGETAVMQGERFLSFKAFHYAKMALDDQIGMLQRGGKRGEARTVAKLKNELLAEMDEASPDYRAGRDLYAGDSALMEAADTGRKFFSLSLDEFGDAVAGMSQSEREMFKRGAVKAIVDKLDDAQLTHDNAKKLVNSNALQAKLGVLFKSRDAAERFVKQAVAEREFTRTRTVVTGGSPTSQNLAGQEGLKELGAAAVRGDKEGVFQKVLAKVFGDGEPTPETIKEAAGILLKRGLGEDEIRRIFKESTFAIPEDKAARALNAVRGTVAPTGTAALESRAH